jgi:hypothetical protein
MKRITVLVLLFAFGFAFAVLSEDLGELAKKEKARRESIEKAGKKAKVFTNEDIGKLKSQNAMESSTTPAEGQTTSDDTYKPPVEGEEYVSPQEPPAQQPDPAAQRNNQLRELEEKREELEKQAKEARETVGSGGLWHSRNTGDQYRIAREAEANASKVDKQIDEIESKRSQRSQPPPSPAPVVEEYVPPGEEATAEETPADEPAASEDTTNEEPPL